MNREESIFQRNIREQREKNNLKGDSLSKYSLRMGQGLELFRRRKDYKRDVLI